MGMLSIDDDKDLLDAKNWSKSKTPVFQSDMATHQYGPGHNSFTVAEDGQTDILVYHCRDYTEIKGDPLYIQTVIRRFKRLLGTMTGPLILVSRFLITMNNKLQEACYYAK